MSEVTDKLRADGLRYRERAGRLLNMALDADAAAERYRAEAEDCRNRADLHEEAAQLLRRMRRDRDRSPQQKEDQHVQDADA